MLELDRVYTGDCLKLMKELPDNSVDLVLTDPPYGINYGKYISHDDDSKEYSQFMKSIIDESVRVSKGWCAFYQTEKRWMLWHEIIPFNAKLVFLMKTFAPYRGNEMVPSTDIVFVWKVNDKAKYLDVGQIRRNWFICPDSSITNNKINHPCPRPMSGVKYLLGMLDGDIVLDPFAGSGTTLVAAKELGRKFIGMEISQKYVDICNERLKQEVLRL